MSNIFWCIYDFFCIINITFDSPISGTCVSNWCMVSAIMKWGIRFDIERARGINWVVYIILGRILLDPIWDPLWSSTFASAFLVCSDTDLAPSKFCSGNNTRLCIFFHIFYNLGPNNCIGHMSCVHWFSYKS